MTAEACFGSPFRVTGSKYNGRNMYRVSMGLETRFWSHDSALTMTFRDDARIERRVCEDFGDTARVSSGTDHPNMIICHSTFFGGPIDIY